MTPRDGRAFELVAQTHFEKVFRVKLRERNITVNAGSQHISCKVDLASEDNSILIACKSYTFTSSGKEPAHKLEQAKSDGVLLALSPAKHKILIFDDDVHAKKGS